MVESKPITFELVLSKITNVKFVSGNYL